MNSRDFNARAIARALINSRVHWGEKCTFSRWIRNFIFISISLLFGLNLHFRRQNIEILQKIVFVWLPIVPHKFVNEISSWFFVSFIWFLAEKRRLIKLHRCLVSSRWVCFVFVCFDFVGNETLANIATTRALILILSRNAFKTIAL